jgi:Putative phage tail protein
MSGLLFGGGSQPPEPTRYGTLQIQSATQGLPIPIIYGRVKTAANLLWYDNFKAIRHESSVGGKGGGSVTSVSYTYTTGIIFGLGEGVLGLGQKVWKNQGITSYADLGLLLYEGDTGQAPWGFTATEYAEAALSYSQIAYLCHSAFDLGTSNYTPQLWFEVLGHLGGTAAVGPDDAGPAQVIWDFCTNTQYGANFPMLDHESLFVLPNCYANYCGANGIGFSDTLARARAAREWIADWLEVTNTAAVWSGDVLKFVPFGDQLLVQNGVTYTPQNTIRYHLTDEDFLTGGSAEPVEISRRDPYDCYNHIRLQVVDKDNNFNAAVVESKDQASIEDLGLRSADLRTAPFISNPSAGMRCVELMKNRLHYVRNTFQFSLSWEYVLLEPMDIVSLTQANLGLLQYPVRIMEIVENDDGTLQVTAEEFMEGAQWAPEYPSQTNQGYTGNSFVAPGMSDVPLIFEPNATLLNGAAPQVWFFSNGNASTWGGARVWISLDGNSYQTMGRIPLGCVYGATASALPAYSGTNPDNVNTLRVNLHEGAQLISVSAIDAQAGRSLCYVGGEYLSYTTATLVAAGVYDLTGLYRGQFGSTTSAHVQGASFALLNNVCLKYTLPSSAYIGQQFFIKLTSFNIYGQSEQTLDQVSASTYVLTGLGSQQSTYLSYFIGGKPAAGAKVVSAVINARCLALANFAGSKVLVGTLPTAASTTWTLAKNGTSIGQLVIPSNGSTSFSTTATTFEVGDVFSVTAAIPQDPTLSDVTLNLLVTQF